MNTEGRIVVIAGTIEGIQALARLVEGLPARFPAPILVVVRGACEPALERLFRAAKASRTDLSVRLASDGEQPAAGHLYLAPAESDLDLTAAGTMVMRLKDHGGRVDQGADELFRSAATLYGERVIGVILSGGGDYGTQGFKAITQAGGTRVVQSPADASYPAMPTSALLSDDVEHTVLLDRMGSLLFDLANKG
jgi:two-component system chemotaxis response regulator CheB